MRMLWTEETNARLLALVGEGLDWDTLGEQLGCTASAVYHQWRKIRGRELAVGGNRLPRGATRGTPAGAVRPALVDTRVTCDSGRPQQPNNRKHLQSLHDANGYGFTWWPPSLMERVYTLEIAPSRGREFWRAA